MRKLYRKPWRPKNRKFHFCRMDSLINGRSDEKISIRCAFFAPRQPLTLSSECPKTPKSKSPFLINWYSDQSALGWKIRPQIRNEEPQQPTTKSYQKAKIPSDKKARFWLTLTNRQTSFKDINGHITLSDKGIINRAEVTLDSDCQTPIALWSSIIESVGN